MCQKFVLITVYKKAKPFFFFLLQNLDFSEKAK